MFRLLVAALVFSTIAASAAATPVGSVVSIGTSWSCTGPVDLTSVTVTIGAGDPSNDGVFLRSGCTGYIGSITVEQWHGDGIKVGAFAGCTTTNPCLEIGSINIHCYGHDAGKHQDGVQVMGGNNIRFDGGYIGCYSANDSQAMIHEGAANQQLPTNVIFDKLTADAGGVQDPTGKPLYTYGDGGAYGLANGQSANSGFTNLTLLSLSHLHDLFQGAAVVNAVWSFTYLPPGVRKSPGIP